MLSDDIMEGKVLLEVKDPFHFRLNKTQVESIQLGKTLNLKFSVSPEG